MFRNSFIFRFEEFVYSGSDVCFLVKVNMLPSWSYPSQEGGSASLCSRFSNLAVYFETACLQQELKRKINYKSKKKKSADLQKLFLQRTLKDV